MGRLRRILAIAALAVSGAAACASLEFSDVASFLCPSGETGSLATLLGTVLWSAPPQDREVQWLESTGTQYMLFSTSSMVMSIDVWIRPQYERAATAGSVGIYNGASRANSIFFDSYVRSSGNQRGFRITNGNNSGNVFTEITYAYRHVTVHGTAVTVDDASFTMGSTWNYGNFSGLPFALFGCYRHNNTITCKSARIGPCKLYTGTNGNTLAYDLIPYVKDGVGCMYDKLSDTYFYNQGTGEFVTGPDL